MADQQIAITFNPETGAFSFQSTVTNKVIFYGMLDMAKEQFHTNNEHAPKNGLVVPKLSAVGKN